MMSEEDARTRAVEMFLRRLAAEKLRAARRRKEREEAARLKKEQALRNLEDGLRKMKINRALDRRAKTHELLRIVKDNEEVMGVHGHLTFEQVRDGDGDLFMLAMGRDHEPDMIMMISTYITLKAFFEERQRMIEVRKRIEGLDTKAHAVLKIRNIADKDMHRVERALGLITLNRGLVKAGYNADTEIDRLKANMRKSTELYDQLHALYIDKITEVKTGRLVLEEMKRQLTELYSKLVARVAQMQTAETISLQTIAALRSQIQKLSEDRLNKQREMVAIHRRSAVLVKELKRLRLCNDAYVDTDVWTPGYMQRVQKKALTDSMSKEQEKIEVKLRQFDIDLEQNMTNSKDLQYAMKREGRACGRLGAAVKSFKDVIMRTRITDEAMDSIVKSMIEAQWKAELMEERRMKEFDFKRAAAEIGAESEADQLRMKAHELRTTEEKHYIAMDLVLNPEAYSHLTLSEIEQMRLDKDYHTDLSLTDMERIMKLPALITLALPFLFSQEEVEAHRLINKYWRSQDDTYFSEKDAKSVRPRSIGSKTNAPKTPTVNSVAAMTPSMMSAAGGGPGPSPLVLSALNDSERDGDSVKQIESATTTQKNNAIWSMKTPLMDTALPIGPAERKLRDQEARHEILLREARRDRVRCLSFFPHEIEGHPTHEDLAWFEMERLLHPYLFPKIKGVFSGKNQLQTSMKGEESVKERYTLGVSYDYEHYKCPFDADELVEIIKEIEEEYVLVSGMLTSRAPSAVPQGEDIELSKAKRLLKMYFVGLDESDNGHDRLNWLAEVSTGICDQIQRAIDADREEDRQRERDRLKAERRDKQRNLTDAERAKLMKKKKATAKKGNDLSVGFTTYPDISHCTYKKKSSHHTFPFLCLYVHPDRIWGSWDQVHPASAGKSSQRVLFTAASFSSLRDHPAGFAVRKKKVG